MQTDAGFHMSPEEFRRWGHELIDWVADYQGNVGNYPVMSQVEPGWVRSLFPSKAPVQGEAFDRIIGDFKKLLPGITHWQSPNFYAFFPANNSGPSVLGELLSAALGVQGMLWLTSPACTELETLVLDWVADMMGLDPRFKSTSKGGGVIQDSASTSVLCAIIAARERATGLSSNEQGCDGRLTAYTSTQAHSSVEKGIRIAGIGRKNLRMIPADELQRLRPDLLEAAIRKDLAAGLKPFFVSATVGTTSSNGFDDLEEIAKICQEHGLWLHVDGAMCGTAALCPEFRTWFKGLERADSYAFNPHKWMFTNFDCDCFYVADRADLIRALSVLPEYLRNQATESGAVIDYRDWQISLGRRFRALKLWFVIRHYGIEGLQFHIREHIRCAKQFAAWVEQSQTFMLAAPVPMNLVCFRHRSGDEVTRQLLERLNRSGKLYLTHTVLDGKTVLRFCVGQTNTTEAHVRAAWETIRAMEHELTSGKGA